MSKPKVPQGARFMELARRKTSDVAKEMLGGAKAAMKANAPKLANKMKRKSTAKAKKNPWLKCVTCHHRVPIRCQDCMSAEAHVTKTHKTMCCPGPCLKCGTCLKFCLGHEKDEENEDRTEPEADEKDDTDTEASEGEGQS